jgi:hypothetical protein
MFILETFEEKDIKTFGMKLKEAEKGMPDIETLKLLSKALDVSIIL